MTAPPPDILASVTAYERWARDLLGPLLVEADLRFKYQRMREDPFLFLRGTCWRWAEIAADACGALAEGPEAGSVGDAHVGNFGLWRDAEGRLVWGVNDYDEAAVLPYRMDLARLVTSAAIARGDEAMIGELAEAALDGYVAGLADPRPWVLEQDHGWLRDIFAATDCERARFWAKLRRAPTATDVPETYRAALEAAMSATIVPPVFSHRQAGVGSLGRPRIVLLGDDAGGPIAREAKALLPSCWRPATPAGAQFALSRGRYRSPDPFLHCADGIVVRRLAPNSRKIDLNKSKRRVRRRLIEAMARDIGAIHAAGTGDAEAIRRHLHDHGHAWLARAVAVMMKATLRDWHAFRAVSDRQGRLADA